MRAPRRGGTVSRSFWKQQTGSSEDVRDEHRPIAGNRLAVPHTFNPEAGPTALEISLSWTVRPRVFSSITGGFFRADSGAAV